jgi:hypothetical protein
MPGPGSSPGQALTPGIGDPNPDAGKAWMAGTRPAMTIEDLADGYHSQCVR